VPHWMSCPSSHSIPSSSPREWSERRSLHATVRLLSPKCPSTESLATSSFDRSVYFPTQEPRSSVQPSGSVHLQLDTDALPPETSRKVGCTAAYDRNAGYPTASREKPLAKTELPKSSRPLLSASATGRTHQEVQWLARAGRAVITRRLAYATRACKAERSGFAAKFRFHSLGVSSATRDAGCSATRCRTSTR